MSQDLMVAAHFLCHKTTLSIRLVDSAGSYMPWSGEKRCEYRRCWLQMRPSRPLTTALNAGNSVAFANSSTWTFFTVALLLMLACEALADVCLAFCCREGAIDTKVAFCVAKQFCLHQTALNSHKVCIISQDPSSHCIQLYS